MKGTRDLVESEDGSAIVFVAVMLPVLVGFALLAVDFARVASLHNDLQSSADALALAAAAELDGKSDAITRAMRVIGDGGSELVKNSPFRMASPSSTGPLAADNVEVHFLASIPQSDATPIDSSYYTTDPAKAVFVEITVDPTAFEPIFPFRGFNVSVASVAGNEGDVVCAYVPMFICDPFRIFDASGNPTGIGIDAAYAAGLVAGHSMNLLIASQGNNPIAGNFGFLRPTADTGYGEPDLANDIAHSGAEGCLHRRNLYTQTGNMSNKVQDAFGTRFDLWGSSGGFSPTDPTLPVPMDVRKGYTFKNTKNPDGCKLVVATDATKWMAMPPDKTVNPNYPTIGNGDWDSATFASVNQLGTIDAETSRYQFYEDEAATEIATASLGGETGAPTCSTNVQTSAQRADPSQDRRLMNAAIVDCTDPNNLGALQGKSGTTMTAEEFGRFFLIQPPQDAILVEAVDITGPNGDGTMTNFAKPDVELYR